MRNNKAAIIITILVILGIAAYFIFTPAKPVDQQASTIGSTAGDDGSRSTGGGTTPACLGKMTPVLASSAPGGSIVRGQQNVSVYSISVTTGACVTKLNSLTFTNVGTAKIGDFERAIFNYNPSTGGIWSFPANPTVNAAGEVTFTFGGQAQMTIPANAGNTAVGSVPPAVISIWVSISNTAQTQNRTVQLELKQASDISAVNYNTPNQPINVLGTYPIVGSTWTIPGGAGAPSISTTAATGIQSTQATLNSTLLGSFFGGAGQAWFYYGTSPATIFTAQTPHLPITASMTTFSQTQASLSPNTTYFYRSCGQNAIFVCGAVKQFTTLP